MESVPDKNKVGLSSKRPSRRVTCHDIARIAGVGVGTVSRVLNGKPGVSQRALEKVQAAIEKTNYSPSHFASMMRGNRFQAIGMLVALPQREAHLSHHSTSSILGVMQGLESTEYRLVTASVPLVIPEDVPINRVCGMFKYRSLDGVLVNLPMSPIDPDSLFAGIGIPFVLINPNKTTPFNAVQTDDHAVAATATQYLLDRGHRRIGYIGPMQDFEHAHYSTIARYSGYADTMQNAGIDSPQIDYCHTSLLADAPGEVRRRVRLALTELGCTGLVAYASYYVDDILRVCHELERRIPEDVSLVSCDWEPVMDRLVTPITCVAVRHAEMGQQATTMLIRRIENNGISVPSQTVPFEMMENRSVRPL